MIKEVFKVEIITIEDSRYPQQLKEIKNPPKKLYTEGNIKLLKTNIISVIGSRSCSENGKNLAQQFTQELVEQNITIASGMAMGIDTIAHQTTLQEKGKTIAVLGSGLKQIFPKENIELYQQIVQNDGLVITEYSPEEKAKSQNFLQRNRIVSGLALGILVIEAGYRSGTSVTAKLASQQGKKIFALPHEINDIHGIGTNRLIKNGAKVVTNTEDIIKEFPFLTYKKSIKEKESKTQKSRKTCNNEKYHKIYELITERPISFNEICQKSKQNIIEVSHILLMLELEGYIKKEMGGYTCILDKK